MQRISADEVEAAVLKHLKEGLVKAGYFERLRRKIADHAKKSISGNSTEVSRIKNELGSLEQETTNIFRLQAQTSFGSEALQLMSERLEVIAKKRKQYTEHLKLVESNVVESIDAAESAEYIREKFVDFENGFSKATPAQKRRLVRKTIKQVALAKDSLALWFYLNEEDEQVPGRKLKLIRDSEGESGVSLVSEDPSKRQVPCLDIEGLGDPGKN